jgi:hypothetical protein
MGTIFLIAALVIGTLAVIGLIVLRMLQPSDEKFNEKIRRRIARSKSDLLLLDTCMGYPGELWILKWERFKQACTSLDLQNHPRTDTEAREILEALRFVIEGQIESDERYLGAAARKKA